MMKYSKLNWYDLNEIWASLHLQLKAFEDMGQDKRAKYTQHVLDKVNSVMQALGSQPTNQSDYELRIVNRVNNTLSE